MTWEIKHGDWVERLKEMPSESVHCVVTSPPYWGLRDYGTGVWEGGDPNCSHSRKCSSAPHGSTLASAPTNSNHEREGWKGGVCGKCGATRVDRQLGLEKTPEEYVANIVVGFRELRRVLRKDGTLWCNLGDCYNAHPGQRTVHDKAGYKQVTNRGSCEAASRNSRNLKAKDLVGIPWRIAFALQADGWWLRAWMPWIKRNPMPESCEDRPATQCEIIFLLSKSNRYFYDAEAVKMPANGNAHSRGSGVNPKAKMGRPKAWDHDMGSARTLISGYGRKQNESFSSAVKDVVPSRHRRPTDWFVDSWQGLLTDDRGDPLAFVINPYGYSEAHFATFPPKLVEPCVLAGTSERGCCAKCRSPWKRILEETSVERNEEYEGKHSQADKQSAGRRMLLSVKAGREAGLDHDNPIPPKRTIGWEPSCKCSAGAPVPCTVLDPFAGAGTTGLVALRYHRNFIGIELKAEYVEMARRRIEQDAPLFNLQEAR